MGLHLHYLPSIAPYLDEILSPLIRRHIDFKLRDSFRILTPDVEARQDLEQVFLQNAALGGVLIGKSLLTLHSFGQALLLEHPNPGTIASLPMQRKSLKSALSRVKPDWRLAGTALQKCLSELQEWRRMGAVSHSGRGSIVASLDAEFQKVLEARGGAWTADRSLQEAWKLLSRGGLKELATVEELYLLGFRLPEPVLLAFLESSLRAIRN